MKQVSANLIIPAICTLALLVFNLYQIRPAEKFKILEIQNADEFLIDFNRNGRPDKNELVKLYDINAFSSKTSQITYSQSKTIKLKHSDILALGILAEEYSKKHFVGKNVSVEFFDIELNKNNKYSSAKIYLNNKDIAKLLLNEGLATPERKEKEYKKTLNFVNLHENLEKIKKENILIFNTKTQIYHNLDCKFIDKLKEAKAVRKDSSLPKAKKCIYCLLNQNQEFEEKIINSFEFKVFDFKEGVLNFYFTDFNKRTKPDNNCETQSCKILLEEINNAKESIDFAMFGIANQPKIIDSLLNAQNRGVKIRWVTDADINGNNIYKEVTKIQKLLPEYKTDNHIFPPTGNKNYKYTNAIMHNKFFIFDKKILWMSSANLSQTDLADFNSNITVLSKSKTLANIYQQEFEQMYKQKFHELKEPILNKENLKIDETNTVSVYFSPTDKIITNKIIPLIENAKQYIYISSFIITHKGIETALVNAKERGVEIKIITDATSAGGKYSIHNQLRKYGIAVKVENKAGKLHTKSILIDDKTLFGSMNLTKSGESKNDENVMLIDNPKVTKQFKNQFLYTWSSIPSKWLTKNPKAESPDSAGSCNDGIDNDFDGDIDGEDLGCQIK